MEPRIVRYVAGKYLTREELAAYEKEYLEYLQHTKDLLRNVVLSEPQEQAMLTAMITPFQYFIENRIRCENKMAIERIGK